MDRNETYTVLEKESHSHLNSYLIKKGFKEFVINNGDILFCEWSLRLKIN